VLILVAVLVASGCQTLYYYGQAIDGQLSILMQREPIEELIEDPEIDEKLKTRLLFILEVRKFAQKDLHLPVENMSCGTSLRHRNFPWSPKRGVIPSPDVLPIGAISQKQMPRVTLTL
jgi:hypothetical protein